MEPVIKKVYDTILSEAMIFPGDKVLVGLSGGADSVFLLESLTSIRNVLDFEIACAHVNHGIRGAEADNDQEFCRNLCSEKNIDFHEKFCDIPVIAAKRKISEETCGREERYSFFKLLCEKHGFNKIAVAHNMNDSVETVIINMIRGASLKGLSGIEQINGNIIRPVINITRQEIESYLHSKGIQYRTDSTNSTLDYTRNKIRHLILKEMENINPSVVNTIHTNSHNIRCDIDFLNEYTKKLKCIENSGDEVFIDKNIFDSQHPSIKKRILIDAFSICKGNRANVNSCHIDILLGELQSGKKYNMPNGITVYISFDKIIFSQKKTEQIKQCCDFTAEQIIKFNETTIIKSCIVDEVLSYENNALYVDWDLLKNRNLVLRSRKESDKFTPFGMNHSKKIKQFMIETKIPAIQRNNIPLLCADDEIVAVIPYRISEKFKVTDKTNRILKITQEKNTNE